MQEYASNKETFHVHIKSSQKLSLRKKIIIIISISLLLIFGLIIFTADLASKQKSQNTTPENPQQQNTQTTYKNDYWGFAVKYPKSFHMYQSPSGMNYFFDSYAGDAEKDLSYIPGTNELRIRIHLLYDDENTFAWNKSSEFIKEEVGPKISGEKSKVIYQGTSSNDPKIDKINKIIYILTHDGITYEISAEPANSILIPQFKQFIKDFLLTQRITFEKISNKPPSGIIYRQDENLGIIFEYPDTMKCDDEIFICILTDKHLAAPNNPYIRVEDAPNIYNDYATFEENIKHYASLICAASGPSGSTICPIEGMSIEKFKNTNGHTGYKVYRNITFESYTNGVKKTSEIDKDFVIFYKIDSPHTFAIVFSNDSHELDSNIIDISNSFRYLERKH